jgi:hypothetical protein
VIKRVLPKRSSPKPVDAAADEFLESYVSWREACEDVRSAYESWRSCKPPQRVLGFKAYRAALDREEHAAHAHSRWVAELRAAARP